MAKHPPGHAEPRLVAAAAAQMMRRGDRYHLASRGTLPPWCLALLTVAGLACATAELPVRGQLVDTLLDAKTARVPALVPEPGRTAPGPTQLRAQTQTNLR